MTGASSYTVKRAEVNGGPYTSVATGVSGLTFTDTGLTNGKAYYYVISAVNSVGESAPSAQVTATPQDGVSVPGAFTLSGTAGDAQAVLNWTASTGAATYTVRRSTGDGAYVDLAADLTALTYTDAAAVNGTAYNYRVVAINADGQTNSNVIVLTPTSAPISTGTLEVQYRNGGSGASGNALTPQFNLRNTGTTAIDLSKVKLRYYFTKDSSADLTFWCDYAQIGSANVKGSFAAVEPAKGTADTYLEISFTAGAGDLEAGAETGIIQTRSSKNNWTNFDQSNDYSFDGTQTAFGAWTKVTAYQDGVKVWGMEP